MPVRNIEGFATIAIPLTLLMRKGVKFKLEEAAKEVFDTLKEVLVKVSIYDFQTSANHFKFTLMHALVGVLIQQSSNGASHAITCWSRVLKEAEIRHSVIDLEALPLAETVLTFAPLTLSI